MIIPTFSVSQAKKIVVVACLAMLFPHISQAALVPCGNAGQPMCKLCDLIVGIHTLVTYGFGIVVVVALTFIVVGAVIYIVSAGNTGMIEMAKSAMKDACIGIIIVLTAWLIITYSMQVLGAKTDLGIQATKGWSTFTCN